MSAQLDILKDTYETLNIESKKEFIIKLILYGRFEGDTSAAYIQLLSECIQDYNTEVSSNTTITETGKSDIQINNFYGVGDILSQEHADTYNNKRTNTMVLVGFILGLVIGLALGAFKVFHTFILLCLLLW